MRLRNIANKLILVAFMLVIIIPIATTRLSGGEVSEQEKRVLAEIPSTENMVPRLLNREFMQDTENWLNDHIGKRNGCRAAYAMIMYHGLNLSTSKDVVLGQEGYCYFTKNNNLEIAKGSYKLSKEDLQLMKSQYRDAKDYYTDKGIKFYLLMTPSKVSVYPEYLPFESNADALKPAEIIENEIGDSEQVINVKEALISNKGKGRLFQLTDSHWNQRGTYQAYTEILKKINPNEMPIKESYEVSARTGDLFQELGLIKEFDKEEVPAFQYEWGSRKLKTKEIDSELIDALKKEFEAQKTAYIEPEIFVNEDAHCGTLVIYGDSMMASYINIPNYLCEHYNKVVVLRLRKISKTIDNMLQPDTVMFSSTERLLNPVLTQFAPN